MVWAVNLPDDASKIRLSAGYIRQNNAALQSVLTSANLLGATPYIPATHPMYFYSDTAPTGWTILAAPADCLLALKGGASAYNVAGGAAVGTWVGPNYALVTTDLPSSGGGGPAGFYAQCPATLHVQTSAHHHDWSTTRPYAALGILATKNA
jgi:hypothetical protein